MTPVLVIGQGRQDFVDRAKRYQTLWTTVLWWGRRAWTRYESKMLRPLEVAAAAASTALYRSGTASHSLSKTSR